MGGLSVGVGGYLDLDVAGVGDESFEVYLVAAKGAAGGGAGAGYGAGESSRVGHKLHTDAATAFACLDHEGESDGLGARFKVGVVGSDVGAGQDGDADFRQSAARLALVAHEPDDGGGRADEGYAGVGAGVGEVGIFGEQAVAGMDGVGADVAGYGYDAADVEIGGDGVGGVGKWDGFVGEFGVERGALCRGVDGDGGNAQPPAGSDDAAGDFAAIGY